MASASGRGEYGTPLCSVLVPVLNEARSIEDALRSMRAQQLDGAIELILVDGGSTDGTRERLARLAAGDPNTVLLDNPSGATPTSLNLALGRARGTFVARMDAHSEYPEDYLARGIERLGRGDTTWVSGPMVPVGTNRVSRAVALAMATRLGRGTGRRWQAGGPGGEAVEQEYELDAGVFCGVWTRERLLEAGGWDERWLRNQDSEMAGRFIDRGELLVCLPAMAATYSPRPTLSALWRQYRQYGEYRLKTAVAHPRTMRRSHFLAPALVASLAAAVVGPRPMRHAGRVAAVAYAAALATATRAAVRETDRPLDAALVPAVLPLMHGGHGVGFWIGTVKYGPPLATLARAAGLERVAGAITRPAEPVYSPALTRGSGT